MWTTRSEQLADGRVIRVTVNLGSTPVSFAETLRLWQVDADFRAFFMALLADSPFTAFRWETPPITTASANRAFEFILLDSPGLASKPDAKKFAKQFSNGGEFGVVEFLNLCEDSILIVPCPRGPLPDYRHLGAFIRNAPEPQRHALWQLVGAAMQRRLSANPVWLSTAGAGVSWLHVRLDDRPKYYSFLPYKGAVQQNSET